MSFNQNLATAASASNTFEDLSGVSTAAFSNPYDALLAAVEEDPVQLQARYSTHRSTRNAQQKVKLLDDGFAGPSIDPILLRLSDPKIEPGYVDPRHCLVFWGRPTQKVKQMIDRIQQDLLTIAPNLWLMPQECLHITALEITHSKQAEEIQQLVDTMRYAVQSIVDYTCDHRVRLIKPMIGFDASALALSFVPAAGEGLTSGRTAQDDKYTYHHLRRDLFNLCKDTGVSVDSRYVVPSAHLTIGRFIHSKDFENAGAFDPQKMQALVKKIEDINAWLQKEFWPESNEEKIADGGDWILGEEQGLVCRMGTVWYGGGETLTQGKGF